jgi:ubiquitin-protein ligase
MSVRLTRLYADYEKLRRVLDGHPRIVMRSAEGNPPERYVIEYRVRGLEQKGEEVVYKDRFTVEILLPRNYPSESPFCRMLTPVFHPNISPSAICIADEATVSEPLAELVIRIGRMLCYQVYNIKSPRNGEAAVWARENQNRLPTDPSDLTPRVRAEDVFVRRSDVGSGPASTHRTKEPVSTAAPAATTAPCPNCREPVERASLVECANHHRVCPDCTVVCGSCGVTMCVLCTLHRCASCGQFVCQNCLRRCTRCGGDSCPDELDAATGLCRACKSRVSDERGGVSSEPAVASGHKEPVPTAAPVAVTVPCANCAQPVEPASLFECANHHRVCPNCTVVCESCGRTACALCRLSKCASCGRLVCQDCYHRCRRCGRESCLEDFDETTGLYRACQALVPDGRGGVRTEPAGASAPEESVPTAVPAAVITASCANCGQPVERASLVECAGRHRVCADCTVVCGGCGRTVCALCGLYRCASCGQFVCEDCFRRCPRCGSGNCLKDFDETAGLCRTCKTRLYGERGDVRSGRAAVSRSRRSVPAAAPAAAVTASCANCGQRVERARLFECANHHRVCPDCTVTCESCGRTVCVLCRLYRCASCGQFICEDCFRRCARCGGGCCPEDFDATTGLCRKCRSRLSDDVSVKSR